MTGPVRIQLQRRAGWRMPPNTVKVDRTTRWGNPFVVDVNPKWETRRHARLIAAAAPEKAVARFKEMLVTHRRWIIPAVRHPDAYLNLPTLDDAIRELRGKNLACWCHPDSPCHADVLLEIANAD